MTPAGFSRSITTAAVCTSMLLAAAASSQAAQRNAGWPCEGRVDRAYVQTAEATGGVVMLFKPTEIAGSAVEMQASDRHPELVLRAGGDYADGTHEFEFPLDSTVRSAYLFLSMQCLQSVSVVQPSGDELRADTDGVVHHGFSAIRLFTVAAPAPGSWRVRVTGRGYLSILVRAQSDLSLGGVTFGDRGFPVKRERQPLDVVVDGAVGEIAAHFLSVAGAPLDQVALTRADGDEDSQRYTAEVTPPASDFRVAVTGTDANGFRVQRVWHRLVVADAR